jgi:hypothetical protein
LLDLAGKAYQGKGSSLVRNYVNCGQKSFIKLAPDVIFVGKAWSLPLKGSSIFSSTSLGSCLARVEASEDDKPTSLLNSSVSYCH